MAKVKFQFSIQKIIILAGLTCLVTLFSCVDESSRKGRGTVARFGTADTTPAFCTETYNITDRSCITSCPTGTRVADTNEIQDAIDELNAFNPPLADLDDILSNINAAAQVCVNGSGVLRPTNQVFIKKNFCACSSGKAVIVNDCEAICSSKTTPTLTLYGSTNLGPDILLNEDLGNLFNWCNVEITGSDFTAPGCRLEVFDGTSTQFLDLNIPAGSNTFTANLETLEKEKTYIARIKESESGSEAQSQPFQIYLKDLDTDNTSPVGPLKIMPVSQYTCIFRSANTDQNTGERVYLEFARQHYYFAASNTPPSLPPNNPLIICHDIQNFGENDSPIFPRLELINQHFAVWDQSDVRFNDGNSDGAIDINAEITEEFKIATNQENNAAVSLNLFSVFPWRNLPEANGFKDITEANLGLVMIPFVDANNRGECPNRSDYLGNNPLYRIVGDKVGVDTEGLFMAESEPYLDGNGGTVLDILMIKESDLNQVWFYFENGQHFVPDEITSGSKTIHFYWPLDKSAPYIRKSNQIIYTVRFPDQIGRSGVTTGIVEGVRPPDKRFACIPASNSPSN